MITAPPVETITLQQLPLAHVPGAKPLSPRSALAATYSTYVVRVHTRHGIKTISFDLLAAFFTYTAKKAAEDLGISSRTLIRVCRSLGIRRWPYLGFRSEKNVERIRQEAIENLRRKLERETPDSTSSTLGSNASCLRGASAKRLLQVKVPQACSVPYMAKSSCMHIAPSDLTPSSSGCNATSPNRAEPHSSRCIETISSPSTVSHVAQAMGHHHRPPHALLTPPPTQHPFNLDNYAQPSISPRPLPALQLSSVTPIHMQQLPKMAFPLRPLKWSSSPPSVTSLPSSMPSLNVLVDASILTAFKHELESHLNHSQPTVRTMSMRDILSA